MFEPFTTISERTPASETAATTTREVPTARLTGNRKRQSNIGTITSPPPMPRKPATKPAAKPPTTNQICSARTSTRLSVRPAPFRDLTARACSGGGPSIVLAPPRLGETRARDHSLGPSPPRSNRSPRPRRDRRGAPASSHISSVCPASPERHESARTQHHERRQHQGT